MKWHSVDSPDERMALLIGWEWRRYADMPNKGRFLALPGSYLYLRSVNTLLDLPIWDSSKGGIPDFTEWKRYPDMQEYVRGLTPTQQMLISEELDTAMIELAMPSDLEVGQEFMYINPTILRDACVEVGKRG